MTVFVSEIDYRSTTRNERDGDFLEITFDNSRLTDLNNIVLHSYSSSGAPIGFDSSFFPSNPVSISLQDIYDLLGNTIPSSVPTTLGGSSARDLQAYVHPDNSNWTIFQLPTGLINASGGTTAALALTDGGTVLSAYDWGSANVPLLTGGAADGTLTTNIGSHAGSESLQIDCQGTVSTAIPTPGDSSINCVVCFVRGTRIKTRDGERLIEDLCEGDMVLTMDHGYQPIRWIGGSRLGRDVLAANNRLLPIRIRAGALGVELPEQDLRVSPQHRVLVRSKIAQRMFGSEEVLVPAKKLLMLEGIEIEMDCEEVEYFHMLFDAHQIVFSNGALTESLFTGPEALKAVSQEARDEILAIFPEIASPGFTLKPARLIPEKGRQVASLITRHVKNQVALCS